VDEEGERLQVARQLRGGIRDRGSHVLQGHFACHIRLARRLFMPCPGTAVLRRKLFLNLFPLVLLLLITAVVAIALLQGVLGRLSDVKQHADTTALMEAELVRFRWTVLGLGIVFLVLINLSVVLLLRAAGQVLRPVDKLVEATRELAHEHFDHRVQLEANDEFDCLAEAYNSLADHLQQNEKQRMKVLAQVGLALNHELNNAMATMELQLGMLGRGASGDLQAERRLRTIHESLNRMKETVQSLKSVRRIVLTEYSPGMQMLDLVQSVREDQTTSREVSPW
jgi:HAMP domain-containing protein